MADIVPSPEWSTVSFPVFEPSPTLPSQPAAAAAVPVVVDTLRPAGAPTVNISCPARPPERYVASLLYSGDSATACTGLAKFRRETSFMSTRDWTQTLPSSDEVAI